MGADSPTCCRSSSCSPSPRSAPARRPRTGRARSDTPPVCLTINVYPALSVRCRNRGGAPVVLLKAPAGPRTEKPMLYAVLIYERRTISTAGRTRPRKSSTPAPGRPGTRRLSKQASSWAAHPCAAGDRRRPCGSGQQAPDPGRTVRRQRSSSAAHAARVPRSMPRWSGRPAALRRPTVPSSCDDRSEVTST